MGNRFQTDEEALIASRMACYFCGRLYIFGDHRECPGCGQSRVQVPSKHREDIARRRRANYGNRFIERHVIVKGRR